VVAGVLGRTRGQHRLASAPHADTANELQVDPHNALDLTACAAATGGATLAAASASADALTTGGGDRPLALHKLWPLCLFLALLFYLSDLLWRRSPWRARTTSP
jgi:hypothetical protein